MFSARRVLSPELRSTQNIRQKKRNMQDEDSHREQGLGVGVGSCREGLGFRLRLNAASLCLPLSSWGLLTAAAAPPLPWGCLWRASGLELLCLSARQRQTFPFLSS